MRAVKRRRSPRATLEHMDTPQPQPANTEANIRKAAEAIAEVLQMKQEFIGELGSGHPAPDIGFAEGKFFLVNQTRHDYVSPALWVEKVEARVGIDTTNDGMADTWSDWRGVTEQYESIEGFANQVNRIPASMDLSTLPEGYGFCFELCIEDTTANKLAPILDRVEICFQE